MAALKFRTEIFQVSKCPIMYCRAPCFIQNAIYTKFCINKYMFYCFYLLLLVFSPFFGEEIPACDIIVSATVGAFHVFPLHLIDKHLI